MLSIGTLTAAAALAIHIRSDVSCETASCILNLTFLLLLIRTCWCCCYEIVEIWTVCCLVELKSKICFTVCSCGRRSFLNTKKKKQNINSSHRTLS